MLPKRIFPPNFTFSIKIEIKVPVSNHPVKERPSDSTINTASPGQRPHSKLLASPEMNILMSTNHAYNVLLFLQFLIKNDYLQCDHQTAGIDYHFLLHRDSVPNQVYCLRDRQWILYYMSMVYASSSVGEALSFWCCF